MCACACVCVCGEYSVAVVYVVLVSDVCEYVVALAILYVVLCDVYMCGVCAWIHLHS